MSETRLYSVRPFSKPARTDFKDVYRVFLSASTLLLHRIRSGDPCKLQTADGTTFSAIAWAAAEKIQDNIVQTSKVLQELHSLKLGDKLSIQSQVGPITEVQNIALTEVSQKGFDDHNDSMTVREREHWKWFLEYPLSRAENLSLGLVLGGIELKGQRRSFKVVQINGSKSSDMLYRFVASSAIELQNADLSLPGSTEVIQRSLTITKEGIGGLARQLDQLNERLDAYTSNLRQLKLPSYYRPRRGGILLYGQPGTGKTLVLQKTADLGWRRVLHINAQTIHQRNGNIDTTITRIFAEARNHQPSVIIIDRLEMLAGRGGEDSGRAANVTASLCEEFAQLHGSRVLVIAATVDLSQIDQSLRRHGCFEYLVEIPVPDSRARGEILKILSDSPQEASNQVLESLGDRTHGYVGADLDKVVQLGVDIAKKRILEDVSSARSVLNGDTDLKLPNGMPPGENEEIVVEVTEADLNNALLEVRPTAMQEVFLETPKVQWSDIGGQHETKKALEQAVEWPFKRTEAMARLGISPKKGLLLYGPPGCSKTLTAAAVANSSGLNFLAVKGAELLNMYVGESERAVREVFRKARAASPSIIFFDEIDAIGSSSQHAGLHTLTTLLNEMDGIEALTGVFVLAATNKPEVLDPALIRPGRLDDSLYIGPPDLDARREILRIRTGKTELCEDVNLDWIAERTDGYSGAELVTICQKAAYATLEEEETSGQLQKVGKRHFDTALETVQRKITPEMRQRYEQWGRRETAKRPELPFNFNRSSLSGADNA